MTGGSGDDTYVVDNASDTTVEAASGGTDTVLTTLSLTLASEVENVTVTGAGGVTISGNASNNVMTGNAGGDVFYAGNGDDTLTGGDGGDQLYGELGDDVLVGGAGGDQLYDISGTSGVAALDGGDGDDLV